MNCCFVRILFIFCLIIATFSGSIGDVSNSELSEVFSSSRFGDYSKGLTRSSGRSLLSHSPSKHDTAIVAAPDGTVYLVDSKSRRVIWSFATGPPIYSSYQASTNHNYDKENATEIHSSYFIDIGDDWQLYGQTGHFDRVKLPMTIEEFVRITPYVSEDRTVILGSKNTTAFVVEAKTGRLLRTHGLPNSGSTFQRDLDEGVLYDNDIKEFLDSGSMNSDPAQPPPLHITRTDYTLQQFAPNSGKVSWSLTVAEFGAVLVCQDDDNPLREAPLNSRYELGSQFDNHFSMPLSCQSKVAVYRIRNRDMFETFFMSDKDIMLPGPESNKMLPPQPKIDNFLNSHHENMILPAPALNSMLPLQPTVDKYSNSHHNDYSDAVDKYSNSRHNDYSEAILPLPPVKINNPGMVDVHNMMMPHNDVSRLSFRRLTTFTLIGFFVVMFLVIYHYVLVPNDQVVLDKQPSNSDSKAVPSKKKKVRKSGKNNGSVEKKDNLISTENEDGFVLGRSDNKKWLNLNKLIEGGADGRRIGKLLVSNTEIAKGSNGTIVLEGVYEGRPVAVKRLVQAHHDVAYKEIQNLIASDRHPNIVRWYGVEYDQDFVYLSLERCTCSLDDLIQIYSDSFQKPVIAEDKSTRIMLDYEAHLDSVKGIMQDINLWKSNGHSSPLLLKLMRDVVSGLVHLHELGIIHRDLKPQNVLIIKERTLCAKLSDMGISRRLLADMSSLGHQATGCGSSGWQAPEQLLHGRQTRAVDLFSLGCVLFFCITGGRHPFGDRLERDINIVKNQKDLFLVENIPEAVDLFSHLLNPDPESRPKALEVLHHPLFWNSEMKLSFLRDTSDRVELEDRETGSDLLKALESIAQTALGVKWDEKMEPAFITNIGRYRRYNYDSVRDLLRVMRNKLNHYRELPKEIQELLGSVPEGFDNYFASRFPKLLIEVYKVVRTYCREEECFQKYFASTVV